MTRGKVRAIVADLQKRAKAGDPRAKVQLANLVSRVSTALAVSASPTTAGAVSESIEEEYARRRSILSGDDDARGPQSLTDRERRNAAEDEVFGDDELDQVDKLISNLSSTDELVHKAAIRSHRQSQLNQQAPFTRIQPPSSVGEMIGNQVTVSSEADPNGLKTQSGALSGTPKDTARWQGADDSETAPVSILFDAVGQINAASQLTTSTIPLRPYGIIRFGTRGFLLRAEVDIGLGTQFTIPASAVVLQVALERETPDSSFFGHTAVTQQLTGMLSFLPVFHDNPVTRTVYFDIIQATQSTGFRFIPAFAKTFYLVRFVGGAALDAVSVTVEWEDSSGTVFSAHKWIATDEVDTIPVPTGAVAFQLTNNDGASPISAQGIFGLAF